MQAQSESRLKVATKDQISDLSLMFRFNSKNIHYNDGDRPIPVPCLIPRYCEQRLVLTCVDSVPNDRMVRAVLLMQSYEALGKMWCIPKWICQI